MSNEKQTETADCLIKPGRQIAPCRGLTEVIGRSHNDAGGGVRIAQLVKLTTFEASRQIVILHSGRHNKKGIVMNFCPFCGTDLTPLLADGEEAA